MYPIFPKPSATLNREKYLSPRVLTSDQTAMPKLIAQIRGQDMQRDGPQTPAQKFFAAYAKWHIDGPKGPASQFFSRDAVFHNTNNADYHGADVIWEWIRELYEGVERLRPQPVTMWEIRQDDGTTFMQSQMVRSFWALKNKSEEPDVSIPTLVAGIVAPSDDPSAVEGLQWKECWIYFDTMLLAPSLGKDSVWLRSA